MTAAVLAGVIWAGSSQAAPPNDGWSLEWSDEFAGSGYNAWTPQQQTRRDALNTTEAIDVADGVLRITTFTDGGVHKTGFLTSKAQFGQGYFEARMRSGNTAGAWHAFWLMAPTMALLQTNDPQVSTDGASRLGVEIDITEILARYQGSSRNYPTTIHWAGYADTHQSVTRTVSGPIDDGQWHTFGLLWDETGYRFYMDGVLMSTIAASDTVPVSRIAQDIKLTSEVRHQSWAGNIPAGGFGSKSNSSTFLDVDYVRYYGLATDERRLAASGDWNTTQTLWRGAGDAPITWINQSNAVAQLSGGSRTLRTSAAIETHGIVVQSGAHAITSGPGGSLTLVASTGPMVEAPYIEVASGGQLTVESLRSTAANFDKLGGGTLALTGTTATNDLGNIYVKSGVLDIRNARLFHGRYRSDTFVSVHGGAVLRVSSLAYGTGNLGHLAANEYTLVLSGGQLQFAGDASRTHQRGFRVEQNATISNMVAGTTQTIRGGEHANGQIHLSNTRSLTIDGPGDLAVMSTIGSITYTHVGHAGTMSDTTGSIIKRGQGTLTLGGANRYAGGTTVHAGTLRTAHDRALGTGQVRIRGGTLAVGDGESNRVRGISGLILDDGATLSVLAEDAITLASGTFALGSVTLDLNDAFNAEGQYVLIRGASGGSTLADTITFTGIDTGRFAYELRLWENNAVLEVTAIPDPPR